MTVRASNVMDWRKTRGRSVHRFGTVPNAATSDGTNAIPIMVVYGTSRESLEASTKTLTGRNLDTLMLKRAQMLQ
jgi:hypothetical protein